MRIEIYKGASDTNLLTAQQSRDFAGNFADLTANGQILVYSNPSMAVSSIYDLNSKSSIPILSSPTIVDPGSEAQVFAINSLGQMVGQQGSNAVFYDSFHATPILMKELVENLGDWKIHQVSDISETGEIIVSAYGGMTTGEHALKFVPITPVPQPGTFLILASASAI